MNHAVLAVLLDLRVDLIAVFCLTALSMLGLLLLMPSAVRGGGSRLLLIFVAACQIGLVVVYGMLAVALTGLSLLFIPFGVTAFGSVLGLRVYLRGLPPSPPRFTRIERPTISNTISPPPDVRRW
jgi:hypothetical protein